MPYEHLIYEKPEDGVAVITLNRPEVLNAVHLGLLNEIYAAVDEASADDEICVLIYRGAGRAFSSGRDFKNSADLQTKDPEGWWAWRNGATGFGDQTWCLPKVTMAQVHGYAIGMGAHLACLSDITVAAEGTKIGYSELRWGELVPDHVWHRLIGPKKTKEYMFTGRTMDAQEAYTYGLFNKVVPEEELEETVMGLARDMVANERRHPGYLRAWKTECNKQHPDITHRMSETRRVYEDAMQTAAFLGYCKAAQEEFFTRVAEQGVKKVMEDLHAGFSSVK